MMTGRDKCVLSHSKMIGMSLMGCCFISGISNLELFEIQMQ